MWLRRGLPAAYVVGLVCSINLSEGALLLLALLWLWRLREPEVRRAQVWPLWIPVAAFVVASLLSAIASGHAAESLAALKTLLLIAGLYVTADALEDAREADRFLSRLALSATLAALAGVVQVLACPASEPAMRLARWFFHRCDRARGFFSIYMTLAGVLSLVLLSTLPRLLPAGGARIGWAPAWLLQLGALVATYTRGAWIGFAAGAVSLPPPGRRGRGGIGAGLAPLRGVSAQGPHQPAQPGAPHARSRRGGRTGAALHVAERVRHVGGAAAPRLGPGRRQARVLPLRAARGLQEAHGARAQHAAADPRRARHARPRGLAR